MKSTVGKPATLSSAASQRTAQSPARLSPERRRAQLLRCAVAAFAQHGIARAGHAQVAEIAGVSVPSVFRYFPSRDALVNAVLTEVERKFLDLAQRSHKPGRGGREAMQEHARGFIEIAVKEPDFAYLWLDWSGALRDDVWPRFIELEKKLARIIASNIGRAGEASEGGMTAQEAALALNGVAHVLIHMIAAPGQLSGDPEGFARHVIDSLLRLPPGADT